MGGGNRERAQAQTNYNQAQSAATTESSFERRRREINESILNAVKSGDYRNPPNEAKVFFNPATVADRKRQRDVLNNTRGQGVGALGAGANPTLLALNKEHMDAELEEDSARQYQDTWARVAGGAASELADLDAADRARRMGVLSSAAGVYNQQTASRGTPWWQQLMNNAAQGAGAAATGGFRKGGKWDKHIGEPVVVGEEGKELALAPDGRAQVLGEDGPEVVVPKEPATVLPAEQTQQLIGDEAAGGEWQPPWLQFKRSSRFAPGSQSQTGDVQSGAAPETATRPRRAPAPTPDESRAALLRLSKPDPNAPVNGGDATLLAAEPSAQPTAPPAAVNPPGYDETATEHRPRWSSELNKETEHNLAERDAVAHPEERHGWKKKVLSLLARGFLSGTQRGGIGGGMGGAIVGGVTGAVDARAASRAAHREALGRSDQRLAQLRGQRKEDAALAQTEAQTDWLRARPEIEGRKIDAATLKQSQGLLAREIGNRLKEPRPFHPANDYDADLARRAQAAHVQFSPGMFGPCRCRCFRVRRG